MKNIIIRIYSYLINKYFNDDSKIQKLYLTNNIIEALHAKINYNLLKRSTTIYDFVNAMIKIFLDDTIKITILKDKIIYLEHYYY